jgi:hypothetical protein
MMGYHYDLFVSYKTSPEWNGWTRKHLYKNLMAYLTDELPGPPNIYIDDHTKTGTDWVNQIGSALGRSKALVAVLSVPYFSSQWCLHELDMMHSRRLTNNRPTEIIFPIVVNTSAQSLIPPEIERIQRLDLSDFRNIQLTEGTHKYEQFSERMKELSQSILTAIQQPPPYEEYWMHECKKRFNEVFEATSRKIQVGVKTLTLYDQPRQTTVPRVRP